MSEQEQLLAQVMSELERLRQRVVELEKAAAEAQRTAEALRASERWHRQLIGLTQEGIWAIDHNACTTFVNSRMAEMLGYTVEEMMGASLFQFMDDAGRARAQRYWERRRQGIRERHDFEFERKDGSHIYTVLETIPLLDEEGRFAGALATILDLTEQRRMEEALREARDSLEACVAARTLELAAANAQLRAEIAERQQISEALRASETRYRTLVAHAPVGIYQADARGNYLYVNARWCEMAGMASLAALGQGWLAAVHPEDRERVKDAWQEAIQRKQPFALEYRFLTAEGRVAWVHGTTAPLHDEKGQVIGYLGANLDITARKLAEQALQESETRYRRIVETANEGIWAMDENHQTTFVNAQMAAMLGYTPEEMIGQPVETFMFAEDLDNHRMQMVGRHHGLPGHYERRFRRKDGSALWTIVSATALIDDEGRFRGSFAMFTDITERRQMEEALRASEMRFRGVFEQAPLGIALLNTQGEFLAINQALERMLGYNEAELRMVGVKGITHADDYEADRRFFMEMVHGQRTGYQMEKHYLRKDGAIVVGRLNVSLVHDPNGQPAFVLGMVEDITPQKQAEEALLQSNRELQERNTELDAFAHTVAHDLKSPLTMIVGYAEAIDLAGESLPAEERQSCLQHIIQDGQRMSNIIDELLLLAEVRKQDVVCKPLDMARIVAEAQRRLDYLIASSGATITTPASWPRALGYAPWVEEIWVNYLSNALKYGGRPPQIELGSDILLDANGSPARVRFWVRDQGPGLSPEQQAQLFVPFTRLSQVRVQGHGLGLSIVQRIAEKLGGTVGVESEVGRGSLFYFTLPFCHEADFPDT